MRVSIARWGNSLALRIPQAFAKELALSEDMVAELRLEGDRLVLAPLPPDDELERLLSGITDENRHVETDWGPVRGQETW